MARRRPKFFWLSTGILDDPTIHEMDAGERARKLRACVIDREINEFTPHVRFKGAGFTEWDATRNDVFRRDGHVCTYCGTEKGPFHCDHIIPRTRGGSDDPSNLTTACWKCNQSKNNRTPEEWQR